MSPEPLACTVVLPVHNGTRFIDRALASIAAQDRAMADIVIVDDGSTDDLRGHLHRSGFEGRYLHRPQGGPAAATNTGIRVVSTPLVAFLDHDDEWAPGKADWQGELLDDSDLDVVVGSVVNTWDLGDRQTVTRDMGPARLMPATTFRTSCFDIVGLLPEDGRIHETVDWWSRAAASVRSAMVDRPALVRHIHGGNLGFAEEHQERTDLLARLRAHRHRSTP